MEAYKICDMFNLEKPIAEQVQYSMLKRRKIENEYRDLFLKYKMGTTTFSPLYSGVLSGKYLKEIPRDSRYLTNREATPVLKVYFDNKHALDIKINKIINLTTKKLSYNILRKLINYNFSNHISQIF